MFFLPTSSESPLRRIEAKILHELPYEKKKTDFFATKGFVYVELLQFESLAKCYLVTPGRAFAQIHSVRESAGPVP